VREAFVEGLGLWSPGYPTPQAWTERRRDPFAVKPECRLLASRLGRFTSLVTRLAVEVLDQAVRQGGVDPSTVATVFGSANGEIRTVFEQLDMIDQEGSPSPARFGNSVHNAASGLFSIASKNMGFTTALSADRSTFAVCLLEALAWLDCGGGSVVLSVADEPLPAHLVEAGASFDPLGIGVLLSPETSGRSLGRIGRLRWEPALEATSIIPPNLAANPCAAGLHLVEALLHGRTGTVPLEPGGAGWCLDLLPSRVEVR
jgi:hypothetical protein